MRQRIGLDLINLTSFIGGMGRLAHQLLEGLSQYDHGNEYFLFVNEKAAQEIRLDPERFKIVISNAPKIGHLPRNQVFFGLRSWLLPQLDILHSPVSASPLVLVRPRKTLITVTDLAHLKIPETSPWQTRFWRNTVYPICFRKATHIAAISESTKNDIVLNYRIPDHKISVIYLFISVDCRSYSSEESRNIQRKFRVPEKYLLHVGYSHKRKNQLGLINAFRILKEKTGLPHKLYLVGPGGWDRSLLESFVRESGLENDVLFPGFIPDEDMGYIFSNADAFIFPSFYEGFGYPPLEAMACGTPTIVSRMPSLPEIVGDASLFVDPYDPNDIAEKIESVLSDPSLANSLRMAGFKRIQMFTSERMAKSYLDLYKKIALVG